MLSLIPSFSTIYHSLWIYTQKISFWGLLEKKNNAARNQKDKKLFSVLISVIISTVGDVFPQSPSWFLSINAVDVCKKKKKKKVNQFMSYSQEPRALWHNDIMLNSIKVKQYTADLALVSDFSLTEEVTRLWKKNTPVKWEAASGSLPITLRMCQDWSVFCLSVIWVVLHITGLNGFKLMGLNFSDIFWKGFYI